MFETLFCIFGRVIMVYGGKLLPISGDQRRSISRLISFFSLKSLLES